MKNYSTPTCEVIELELENAILEGSPVKTNALHGFDNGGSAF